MYYYAKHLVYSLWYYPRKTTGKLFKEQAEQIGMALKETFELIAESYATKEKLEELQNEVDELRSGVEKLKQQISA